MATVSIRELARNASSVIDDVARTGRPALVTKRGQPIAAVVPIDAAELEDLVLAKTPEYLADMAAADQDLETGRTRPAADVFAELDAATD
jgi:prevent-host-death family protein